MPRGLGPEPPKLDMPFARSASFVVVRLIPCFVGLGSAQRVMTRGRWCMTVSSRSPPDSRPRTMKKTTCCTLEAFFRHPGD
eukprot:7817153-Pyramimonas_sp.AAC.1